MKPGVRASTASALSSRTAIQPGPLSAHCASTILARSMRRTAATWSTTAASTGPFRISGGAANASPSGVRRTGTRPAAHSCTMVSCSRPPSHAWQVPSVGWPANGSSATGVKMRTR